MQHPFILAQMSFCGPLMFVVIVCLLSVSQICIMSQLQAIGFTLAFTGMILGLPFYKVGQRFKVHAEFRKDLNTLKIVLSKTTC